MNLRIDLCSDNMDINQDNNKFGNFTAAVPRQ